jgi:hypothetical protein
MMMSRAIGPTFLVIAVKAAIQHPLVSQITLGG